jgi:hypothetical protein
MHWCQLKENCLRVWTLARVLVKKKKGERYLNQDSRPLAEMPKQKPKVLQLLGKTDFCKKSSIEGVTRAKRRESGTTKLARLPRQVE